MVVVVTKIPGSSILTLSMIEAVISGTGPVADRGGEGATGGTGALPGRAGGPADSLGGKCGGRPPELGILSGGGGPVGVAHIDPTWPGGGGGGRVLFTGPRQP